ncbi:hypothetical protein FIBSPDRAFT_783108 [Athelia psychrophila]|uniref:Coatomer subunit epsilon n=1 Tax=Athelia psychrophila TaxID=1759441 RepID=A0A166NZT6_9AGAM|nr:hypothetical protein FIBSPDRAFT_783108 [Fibularhizoctonia sp. CBS 109695]
MASELYHVKQQFTLGAYKSLVEGTTLPDPSSPEYTSILLYKARASIAIHDTPAALAILPADSDDISVKSVVALAKYEGASSEEDKEAALEQLRDLCIEIESEGEVPEADVVRVIAGTAFYTAGEVEEALETLGAGTTHENLEAVAVTVHIYLSIHRPDLAKKEFDRSKQWAEDDLLLGLIESSIGFVSGKDGYSNCNSYYTEQIANPSLSAPNLLTARGVTRLMRGEISEARSDLEEAQSQQSGDAETAAALVVASGLGPRKADAEEIWSKFTTDYPDHPLVNDISHKASLFDESAQLFDVPPVAAVGA